MATSKVCPWTGLFRTWCCARQTPALHGLDTAAPHRWTGRLRYGRPLGHRPRAREVGEPRGLPLFCVNCACAPVSANCPSTQERALTHLALWVAQGDLSHTNKVRRAFIGSLRNAY